MERKHKEILFPLLVVLCTAILFFALGYIASGLFGTPYVFQTKPVSETEQTSGALNAADTTSDFDSLDSIPSETLNAIPATTSTTPTNATSSFPTNNTTINTTVSTTSRTTASTTKTAIVTTTTNIETTKTKASTTITTSSTGTKVTTDKINLNTATKEELMEIPGIGPVIADNIIQYREDFGPFTELIQLMEVKGIGEKRYNRWIEYFTID